MTRTRNCNLFINKLLRSSLSKTIDMLGTLFDGNCTMLKEVARSPNTKQTKVTYRIYVENTSGILHTCEWSSKYESFEELKDYIVTLLEATPVHLFNKYYHK